MSELKDMGDPNKGKDLFKERNFTFKFSTLLILGIFVLVVLIINTHYTYKNAYDIQIMHPIVKTNYERVLDIWENQRDIIEELTRIQIFLEESGGE